MHRNSLVAISLAILHALVNVPHVVGEHIVGVSFNGEVYRIDPVTNASVLLSQTEWHFNALAKDHLGRLFATSDDIYPHGYLIQLDPQTGQVLKSLALNKPGFPHLAPHLGALAFSPDGALYGTFQVIYHGRFENELIRIDLDTAAAEVVGRFQSGIQAMTFAADGTLYAMDFGSLDHSLPRRNLVTIDIPTLAMHDLFESDNGKVLDIQTLAFDSSGRLFGGRRVQYEVNLQDGTYTQRGATSTHDIRGMEFVVPEPATLALGSLSLLSLAALRRRK